MNKRKRLVVCGLGMFIALFLLSSFIMEKALLNKIDTESIVRQDAYAVEPQLLQLGIKDINVNKTGENMASVKIIFGVHNPQIYTYYWMELIIIFMLTISRYHQVKLEVRPY